MRKSKKNEMWLSALADAHLKRVRTRFGHETWLLAMPLLRAEKAAERGGNDRESVSVSAADAAAEVA